MKRLFLSFLPLFLAAVTAFGAFLDSDFPKGKPQGPQPPRPPRPIPIPRPPENEVSTLIRSVSVGTSYHHRGLTVFPLTLRQDLDWRNYLTLDEGIRSGQVDIIETGVVAQVRIQNRSRSPLFIMSGEVLVGGKQNRMIREDVVVPSRGTVTIGSYCIEKGRWEGEAKQFRSGSTLTLPGLRMKAARKANQDAVWKDIAASGKKLSVKSPTEDFQSLYESEAARRELKGYRAAFRPIWRRAVAGIVVFRFGRIVGAEIFGNLALAQKLQHKILDSYVLDRLHYSMGKRRFRQVTQTEVRRFLDKVHSSRINYSSTPGEGRSVSISGTANGSALSVRGVVVHLNLFEGVTNYRRVE